jgi:hypothetical protein
MLARATARVKEIGIRVAIGAGRPAYHRPITDGKYLLGPLGGAIGLLFAYWGSALIQSATPPIPYPINLDFSPDLRC